MAHALTIFRPFEGLRRTAARLRSRAGELVHAYPRETIGLGIFGLIAAAVIAASPNSSTLTSGAHAAPPAPPPLLIRPLAADQALKVNAEIPVAQGPNPAAPPFVFKGDANARKQALECLASAVYYEAGNQDEDGGRAVAQVVLNRVRHPAFPASVCGVVYEGSTRTTGCQFTFTCDGSLYRQPDTAGWRRAYNIAQAALSGAVYAPVGYATHYHANYVVPYWSTSMAKNAVVGAHLFYRWAGSWGQPSAFTSNYSGHEGNALALRSAALAVVHTAPLLAGGSVAQAIKDIPGAEALKLSPAMRGDKRVAVRFNLVARKASDEATHEDYAKAFKASDNLKYALSGEAVGEAEKPLGKPAETASTGGAATAQK